MTTTVERVRPMPDDLGLIPLIESDKDPEAYTKESVETLIDAFQGRYNNLENKYASLLEQFQDFVNSYNHKNEKWRRMVEANKGPKAYSSWKKLNEIGDRNTLAQVVGSNTVYEWSEDEGWHKAEGV